MAVDVPSSTSATSTSAGGSGAASVNVNPPTGLTTGDVWLIVAVLDNNGTTTLNTPSGFTSGHSGVRGNPGYPYVQSFWKAAGASESAVTVSSTTGAWVLWCASIRCTGANTTNPIGNVATANPAGTGNSQAAPSVTVQGNGSAVIETYACSNTDDPTTVTITLPAGVTTLQAREGASTYPTAEVGYALRDAGAFAPGNWTNTSTVEGRVAIAIEILPAGGGGGGSSTARNLMLLGVG